MFSLSSKGDFSKTERFLQKVARDDIFSRLDSYGAMGVAVLSQATPIDSGETANAWSYEIVTRRGEYPTIVWRNTHMAGDVSVAILIQYGHGTGTGGYVQGRDFINPAMRPVFDQIAADVWKAVANA